MKSLTINKTNKHFIKIFVIIQYLGKKNKTFHKGRAGENEAERRRGKLKQHCPTGI